MSDPERDEISRKLDELNATVSRLDRSIRGDGETRTGILARIERLERIIGLAFKGVWLVLTVGVGALIKKVMDR